MLRKRTSIKLIHSETFEFNGTKFECVYFFESFRRTLKLYCFELLVKAQTKSYNNPNEYNRVFVVLEKGKLDGSDEEKLSFIDKNYFKVKLPLHLRNIKSLEDVPLSQNIIDSINKKLKNTEL